MPSDRPKVIIVRGHQATPWELRPWELLADSFDVGFLLTGRNGWDVGSVSLPAITVRTLRDLLPRGRIGEIVTGVAGDRYLRLERRLAGAQIVHAEELSFWFAAHAARAKGRPGCDYRLVQTVWETIPFLDTYRNRHARVFRREVLAATDLFLAATERAREGLLLEGVPEERIEVCYPGIDTGRFSVAGPPVTAPAEHVILSPGRLVWEKGHQDVLRAVAALRRGIVRTPAGDVVAPRVVLVGSGPEEARLRAYAAELGIADAVEFGSVPYGEMPGVYAGASCMVLASLPSATAAYHLFDVPRAFWEEQFGMVLAEALAAGLSIVASANGAIPEVLAGAAAEHFPPGDWMELARLLAAGPLSRPPGARVEHPPALVERYSIQAAAQRLADAYGRLLARPAAG